MPTCQSAPVRPAAPRDCAKEHPLGTLALAAGAFALIGYLVTRR